MHASIKTVAFRGIETIPVEVQVHIANGLPSMAIVGLADKAVAESRERVRAALGSIGLTLPPKRIAINLAPADVVKEGARFDLPIALGLLVAMGAVPADSVVGHMVLGELSLHGGIESVSGALPAALAAVANGFDLVCPASCGSEAAWASDLAIIAAPDLMSLLNHLRGQQILPLPRPELLPPSGPAPDLQDLKGQETARRVLEIAAAGAHNLLMIGPPGAGKSMLAARLPGLLPPLTPKEALDVTMLHSVAGQLPEGGLVQSRPYQDPHHSASMPALVGGGARARPGETSQQVMSRVMRARHFAAQRVTTQPDLAVQDADGRTGPQQDVPVSQMEEDARALLELALDRQSLSARGFNRVLRVARTIADLDAIPKVARRHLAEALAYRAMPLLA